MQHVPWQSYQRTTSGPPPAVQANAVAASQQELCEWARVLRTGTTTGTVFFARLICSRCGETVAVLNRAHMGTEHVKHNLLLQPTCRFA